MQKALVKLEQVAPEVDRESMTTAVHAFGQSTQEALDALAFEFARDLKEVFEEQGKSVSGRPPTLFGCCARWPRSFEHCLTVV
jgi:hypothetical protein